MRMSVVYCHKKENVKKNYFCSFYDDLSKKNTVCRVNFNFTSDFFVKYQIFFHLQDVKIIFSKN